MKKIIFVICLVIFYSCNINSNNINNNYIELESFINKKILSIDTLIYYSAPEFVSIDDENDKININNIIFQNSSLQKEYYIEMSKCDPETILFIHSKNENIYIKYDNENKIYLIIEDISSFVPKKQFDAVFKVLESNF